MRKQISISNTSWHRLATLFVLLLGVSACKESDEELNFIHSNNNDYEFYCDDMGGEKEFIVRSNFAKWKLMPANEESEWLDVWPIEGDFDGKFTVTAPANKAAFAREARFLLVANGEVHQEFVTVQTGKPPYLTLDMPSPVVRVPYGGSEKVIVKINSNIGWQCTVAQGAEWITVGDATDTQQTLIVSTNNGDRREGILRFTMVGTGNEELFCEARISQLDKASDPFSARSITIAQLYELTGNNLGEITENVKIEALVTSSRKDKNTPNDAMFVQDETGRGIMIRFSDPTDNIYELNAKVTLHLVGLEFVSDVHGMPYISGFNADCILENENNNALTVNPVEINSISQITEDMMGTLVTLQNVEYSVPFGTYCNIDESNYAKMSRTDFPHLLQDQNGNSIRSYVEYGTSLADGVSFKHDRLLPRGSGKVTGLLVKQEGEYAIRMRQLADDGIADNGRLWTPIAAFYWADRSVMNFNKVSPVDIQATEGTGVLNVKGPSTLLYNTGYCYWRTDKNVEAHSDPKGDKTGKISTYQALNTSGAGWSTCFTGNNAAAASGWLINVSTVGATQAAVVIATSSSSGGSKEWTVLYSTNNGATYTQAADYDVTPWESANGGNFYSCKPVRINLPVECTGQEKLIVKLTPRSKKSAGEGTVSSSGTNRLGYVAIEMR
ncbi:MAG: DUF5689 domain-containing protein [Marinifilaceae bacterium]